MSADCQPANRLDFLRYYHEIYEFSAVADGLSGGTRTRSLMNPNHAVCQLTYTQIYNLAVSTCTVVHSYIEWTVMHIPFPHSHLLSRQLSPTVTHQINIPLFYRMTCCQPTRFHFQTISTLRRMNIQTGIVENGWI